MVVHKMVLIVSLLNFCVLQFAAGMKFLWNSLSNFCLIEMWWHTFVELEEGLFEMGLSVNLSVSQSVSQSYFLTFDFFNILMWRHVSFRGFTILFYNDEYCTPINHISPCNLLYSETASYILSALCPLSKISLIHIRHTHIKRDTESDNVTIQPYRHIDLTTKTLFLLATISSLLCKLIRSHSKMTSSGGEGRRSTKLVTNGDIGTGGQNWWARHHIRKIIVRF